MIIDGGFKYVKREVLLPTGGKFEEGQIMNGHFGELSLFSSNVLTIASSHKNGREVLLSLDMCDIIMKTWHLKPEVETDNSGIVSLPVYYESEMWDLTVPKMRLFIGMLKMLWTSTTCENSFE